ncbi:MAG: hydrolase [Bacillales bacterium]|nr:hydrolase [Bacillales bacterium]
MIELVIETKKGLIHPLVEDGVTWYTERKGVPGKLTFKLLDDGNLSISEGNAVRMKWDKKNVFFGFIFIIKRDKDRTVNVTAYDQMRYLKNKDTYVFKNKTASAIISMIAADFGLSIGGITGTGYTIKSLIQDNKTLFDMIYSALDLTLDHTGKMYVLYDDFGKITLKNIEAMKTNIVMTNETAENFDYQTSIDGETYNKVKLIYENEKTGKRDVFIAQSGANIDAWGVLQYFDTIEGKENGKSKANALLGLYNSPVRTLSLKGCLGDVQARAGASIVVDLKFADQKLRNYLVIEKAKHTFSNNHHSMDLTLIGGGFSA